MEAHEVAEQIKEHSEGEAHGAQTRDRFRQFAAIYVGVAAMLLAIASLGGADATKQMLNANVQASDTYAFYQSKYLRQVEYQIGAEQLELLAASAPGLAPDRLAKIGALVKHYRDTAEKYASEPETGDGKKELLAKARAWEAKRDHAAAQTPNFEYAEALFQIAIVLGSVSIVASSVWLLGVSGALAILGVLLTLNGYLLLVPILEG